MNAAERNAMKGNLDRLIPMVDDLDKDWICNWEDETQPKYYVAVMHEVNKCFISADRTRQRVGAIYMSEATAKTVCDNINKSLKLTIRNGDGEVVVGG